MLSFLYQASKLYEKLSYSEKRLVEYVFNHQSEAVYMPIASLSEAAGVSTATIISAVKKLGFHGYAEAKLSLAAELANAPEASMDFSGISSSSENILQNVINWNIEALNIAKRSLEWLPFQKAASYIQRAEHVYIFGEGAADILAQEARELFIRLGLRCVYDRDWQSKLILIDHATAQDVAVLITTTGVNSNTIELAMRLHNRGVQVIGICNYQRTAFTKSVDILLAPFAELSNIHRNNYTFCVPIMCILEILHDTIAGQSFEYFKQVLDANTQRSKDWSVNKNLKDRTDS